jgi:putative NADH-flavin reductase
MNLLVIGSTGRTGKHVLEQGVQRGHGITAFTRRPHVLDGFQGLKQIIEGDALNTDDLRRAVPGQDAVMAIVAPGDLKPTTVISQTTHNLIIVLKEAGVRRLVITSSRTIVATRPWLAVTLASWVFRNAYADLARAERLVQESGLDWSIVRATMLNDKPFSGQVHTDCEPNATGGDMQLARADYAMALLDVVETPQLIGRAIGVNGAVAAARQRHAA